MLPSTGAVVALRRSARRVVSARPRAAPPGFHMGGDGTTTEAGVAVAEDARREDLLGESERGLQGGEGEIVTGDCGEKQAALFDAGNGSFWVSFGWFWIIRKRMTNLLTSF